MTTYAYDSSTTTLLAVWGTGVGSVAHTVARLNARTPERRGVHLAQALTGLSTTAWLGYSDPGLVELGVIDADIDVAPVLRALRRPHLARAGLLYREGDPAVEAGHAVGRELVGIGSAGVTRAVIADVTDELLAVEAAARGDLAGRARQAVALTRLDASPAQIDTADRLLYEVPMGSERLFTEVEPTAAAVAAAHWLQAAVDVTRGETDPVELLTTWAGSEGLDVTAPGLILRFLQSGHPPLAAVQNLVRSAMLAAKGMILPGDPEPCALDPDGESRFTVLDPHQPARELLTSLTRSVQVCAVVFAEQCDLRETEGDWMELIRKRFDDTVRVEAERTRARLFHVEAA